MSELIERVIDLAIEIQQVPAPSFDERQRAEFVHSRFASEGLADVSVDELGNVFALLASNQGAKPLIISAHLDTVFPRKHLLQTIYRRPL